MLLVGACRNLIARPILFDVIRYRRHNPHSRRFARLARERSSIDINWKHTATGIRGNVQLTSNVSRYEESPGYLFYPVVVVVVVVVVV